LKGGETLADHIADYKEYLEHEKHSSPNTVSSYIRDLHQFIDSGTNLGFFNGFVQSPHFR